MRSTHLRRDAATGPPPPRPGRRRGALAGGVVLAAALGIAGATASLRHGQDAPSAAEIERMLTGPAADPGSARAALLACRGIAASFDDRDVARFLDQYGRAAARADEPEVALVMFARGFLLQPASRWAPSSLLESARLHRHVFDDEAVAQRLARRSLATARALGRLDDAAAAESFLADASERPIPPPTPSNASGSPASP